METRCSCRIPKLNLSCSELRSIPSVKVIRIGTRVPCTLPMRITPELVAILKKYHPLYINTHFNHPAEITPEASAACTLLADAGIPHGMPDRSPERGQRQPGNHAGAAY